MRYWVLGIVVLGLAAGCDGDPPSTDGGGTDGGDRVDGGESVDAGPALDGDTPRDAGPPRDGGTPVITDLCQGLVANDLTDHPASALTRPAIGEAVVDPEFGATLRRISSGAVPMYSTVSAWNADESLLVLYEPGGGHRLFDGRTYAPMGDLPISPNDIEQVYWHTSDPDILYFAEGTELRRRRIAAGATETVRDFDFCTGAVGAGGDPFFTSFDSNVIGLTCGDTHFLYRIDTDTITGTMDSASHSLAPQAAPSGTRAYWEGDVVGVDLALERTLPLASPFEHASMGTTTDGRDIYLSVIFDGSPVGSLVAFDMGTGAPTVIIGEDTGYPYPPGGTHVTGMAYRNPGWAWVSIVGSGDRDLLHGELLVANYETGEVCRAAHHRSTGGDYFAEPHAAASPTGTRAVFGSDWGGGSIDGYVIELPSYTP